MLLPQKMTKYRPMVEAAMLKDACTEQVALLYPSTTTWKWGNVWEIC